MGVGAKIWTEWLVGGATSFASVSFMCDFVQCALTIAGVVFRHDHGDADRDARDVASGWTQNCGDPRLNVAADGK